MDATVKDLVENILIRDNYYSLGPLLDCLQEKMPFDPIKKQQFHRLQVALGSFRQCCNQIELMIARIPDEPVAPKPENIAETIDTRNRGPYGDEYLEGNRDSMIPLTNDFLATDYTNQAMEQAREAGIQSGMEREQEFLNVLAQTASHDAAVRRFTERYRNKFKEKLREIFWEDLYGREDSITLIQSLFGRENAETPVDE